MSKSFDRPPPLWAGAGVISVGNDIYYQFTDDEPNPTLWHWCTAVAYGPRWIGRGTGSHELVSKEPLTLSPSLLCGEEGCPMHGYIRNGRWEQ